MDNQEKDIEILQSGYLSRYPCDIDRIPVYYELQYIAAGGLKLECNDKVYELEGSHCWVCLPGKRYRYYPLEKYGWWAHRYIVFTGKICSRWEEYDLFVDGPVVVPSRLDFAGRIDRIRELSGYGLPLSRLELQNLLERLLIDLKQQANFPDPRFPAWLTEIMSELNAEDCIHPDYSAIAARYGMTRRTLFRNFHKATGTTPHAYHLKTRISYAAGMLEMTGMSLKEIADNAGYKDVFYFSRQFKQYTGQTPGQYRASGNRTVTVDEL